MSNYCSTPADKAVEVRPYKIKWPCADNYSRHTGCKGEMIAGDVARLTSPPQYEHKCNVCGYSAMTVGKAFPYIEYREIIPVEAQGVPSGC